MVVVMVVVVVVVVGTKKRLLSYHLPKSFQKHEAPFIPLLPLLPPPQSEHPHDYY